MTRSPGLMPLTSRPISTTSPGGIAPAGARFRRGLAGPNA